MWWITSVKTACSNSRTLCCSKSTKAGSCNLRYYHIPTYLFYKLNPDNFLGDYVINSAVEPLPAYTFGVRQINVHPYFKFTPQADRFDVAVLQLERIVHYMPHIGTAKFCT